MSSVEVVFCIYFLTLLRKVSIEGNSVDPDPIGSVWSGYTLFDQEASKLFSRRQKQMTFVVIGALGG